MFYVGRRRPTQTFPDGFSLSSKHKRCIIWNLVQLRLTHASVQGLSEGSIILGATDYDTITVPINFICICMYIYI